VNYPFILAYKTLLFPIQERTTQGEHFMDMIAHGAVRTQLLTCQVPGRSQGCMMATLGHH